MKFTTYPVADVSTAHITQKDRDLLVARCGPIERLMTHDDRTSGALFSTHEAASPDVAENLRAHGYSDVFINILADAATQGILFVRFDTDGASIPDAPTHP